MIASKTRAAGSVLEEIVGRTASDLSERKRSVSTAFLERLAVQRTSFPSLHRTLSSDEISVIAEFKRASPSKGVFPIEVAPRAVTTEYMDGGASAISCLTDGPYFHGSLDDLAAVSEVAHAGAMPVPVLRKDFVIDSYQVLEAKAHGADAVLLIAAVLGDDELEHLRKYAECIGLEALVEVHTADELERAVVSGATIIGINNRDLKTLTVDLAVTERLAPRVPAGTLIVAESGIFTLEHVQRMARAGAHAVLVGEALIVEAVRSAAVRRLRGTA